MNKKTIDPTSSPWAAFGVQLRRSREAAGLTQLQLSKKVDCTASHLSYVELAQRPPSLKLAELADQELKTGGTLVLMYWQLKHTALHEGFPEYVNYETRAEQIRVFEINVVPGLLQTRAYATAVEVGYARQGNATLEKAKERVEFRLARQQVLDRDPPPVLHAVLDESCLRRLIGGRDVMVEQLLHLERLADYSNIVIQVAPHELGERLPFTRMIHLLTMPSRKVLAYGETEQRGYIDRDLQSVEAVTKGYDRLGVESMNQADSLAMIRMVRRDLEWTSN
ncbi:Scr1 family TA system antitoxin-like transcriptional regulator [Kitasatospora sp. NPDC101176]|uniref:helix-turn-helix domain-containing protein n=1 Tax=Kitasatospora sp. NPDC101176 TaxID=3364099 RepID=UPI0037F80E0B